MSSYRNLLEIHTRLIVEGEIGFGHSEHDVFLVRLPCLASGAMAVGWTLEAHVPRPPATRLTADTAIWLSCSGRRVHGEFYRKGMSSSYSVS